MRQRGLELSDAQVLVASVEEPDLFVTVFDRHGPAIHAYLLRRAGRQAADDVLGEVWLQAFRSRHRYDTAWSDARPWLYGIARNVLRAHHRAMSRDTGVAEGPTSDPWQDADGRLDAARRQPALRAALATLPDEDREVLLLHAWEGLTPGEVAACLEIPPGTVRWRLHRARTVLKEALRTEVVVSQPESVVEV